MFLENHIGIYIINELFFLLQFLNVPFESRVIIIF